MKHSKKKKYNFTTYYIILISILISPLLILNSSYKIRQRNQSKLNNSAKKNILRNLDFNSDSLEVCSRSSEDLINYFQTGDTNYVKLYEFQEDSEPSNVTIYLINILSDEGDSDDNSKKYAKHLAPMIIFTILGVLCIPGWVIFCCCAFCGCKCFNCCKTLKCRVPFFVIVSILNLLFLADSIIGLIKVNPIFKGFSNTECSLLRFINEVLEGETKNVLPKWGGVSGIINIFDRTIEKIEEMSRDNTLSTTESQQEAYEQANQTFIANLKTACNAISGDSNYKYQTENVFDLAYYFGTNINGASFTQGSYADKWVKEAEITGDVKELYNKLGRVIHSHVNEAMRDAEDVVKEIGDGMEEIKDTIGENILDYSKKIDKYGKLTLRLVFSVLLIISILMETFFICLLIFASRKYNYPNLAGCMKFLIHLFWNILAILVIVIFLVGGLICLVGRIGEDFFEAFSFLISSRNLLSPSPRIFENEASYYLDICINGDGIITDELGIENDLGNIGALKTITKSLDKMIEEITIKEEDPEQPDAVYDEIINEINKRKNNQIDYGFVNSNTKRNLNLSESLSQLNERIDSCNIEDTWSFNCELNQQGSCNSAINTSRCMNPKRCVDELKSRYTSICRSTQNDINAIDKIFTITDYASDSTNANSITNIALNVKNAYRVFLTSAKDALNQYTIKFRPLGEIYNNFVGNGSILGVINCAFIGKNVKVLLNYLNDTIGDGFITLGVVLVVDGFIMLCNIAFTILLLSIIDEVERIRKEEMNIKTSSPDEDVNKVIPSANIGMNVKQ